MAIKKKFFDFHNPMLWGSAIVSFGVVFTFLTKVVDFCRIPDAVAAEGKRIDKLEESTAQIAKVLERQETINEYVKKQDQKEKKAEEEEPVLSPDGKYTLNKATGKWEKVK